MKRNFEVNFQVSLESELSDEELKKSITDAVVLTMLDIKDAQPVGLYLITITEKEVGRVFPEPPLASSLTTDLHMDRLREFEKEAKEDEMWQDQQF